MGNKKLRLAIVGVGNCASSLVQGISHYGSRNTTEGVITPVIGGYGPGDVEVVAAFDVTDHKVGMSLGLAIEAHPNCTLRFADPVGGPIVQRGPTLDGLGKYLRESVRESELSPVDVAQALHAAQADVLVSYLPVGSAEAARHYAHACLAAHVGYVNCMPEFICSSDEWADRFKAANIPAIGDDIKSQVGATIVHRQLAQLMRDRGVVLDRTCQLNFGGNSDFLNMLERERLKSKKISKTQAVTSVMGVELPERDVHVGPSDFVPWLEDRKFAHIRLEGRGWGGAPMSIDLKLEVHDSPNSAGVVMDAIRCVATARDHGEGGVLTEASAFYMKSPPEQMDDGMALAALELWLGERRG